MGSSSPENVSDLIAKPQMEYPPEPRYMSKYRAKIIEASKQGKSDHKTMGVPVMDPDMPIQYLKKRSTPAEAPKKLPIDRQLHHRLNYQRELPASKPIKPIKRSEIEKRLLVQQDFTLKNAKQARKLGSNKERRGLFCVDDRFGNSYPVMLSGMFPVYRNREGFGKIPGTYPLASKTRPKLESESSPVELSMAEVVKSRKSNKVKRSPRRGQSPGKTVPQLEKNKYRGTKVREKSPKGMTRKNRLIENKSRISRKIEQSPKRGTAKKKGRKDNEKTGKQRIESVKRETTKQKGVEDAKINENEDEKSLEEDNQDSNSVAENKNNVETRRVENGEPEDSASSASEVESTERESEENYEDTPSTTISSKSKRSDTTSTSRITIPYQQPRCRYVTEDERAELLNGMKKKWDEMMNKFQCLSFVTDTQPKMKRKSQMENELLKLEKDIKTIERHLYIYVYSDSED